MHVAKCAREREPGYPATCMAFSQQKRRNIKEIHGNVNKRRKENTPFKVEELRTDCESLTITNRKHHLFPKAVADELAT